MLEYIRHSSERIRKSYDRAFEWNTVSSEKTLIPTVSNSEHYKEIVCKKYLDGELDIKVLSSLLELLENKHQNKYKGDIAYG